MPLGPLWSDPCSLCPWDGALKNELRMTNRTIRLVFFCPHLGLSCYLIPRPVRPPDPQLSRTPAYRTVQGGHPVLLAATRLPTYRADYNREHRMPVACRVLVAASAS